MKLVKIAFQMKTLLDPENINKKTPPSLRLRILLLEMYYVFLWCADLGDIDGVLPPAPPPDDREGEFRTWTLTGAPSLEPGSDGRPGTIWRL